MTSDNPRYTTRVQLPMRTNLATSPKTLKLIFRMMMIYWHKTSRMGVMKYYQTGNKRSLNADQFKEDCPYHNRGKLTTTIHESRREQPPHKIIHTKHL